jgi:DNA-binding phage protein
LKAFSVCGSEKLMKRIKSQRPGKCEDSLASELARPAMILEERDVIELLRAAVGRERSQAHFARQYGIDRVQVNRLLNGRKTNVPAAITKALGLRKVFVAD